MFKLNENYEVYRTILKCDCIGYSLADTFTKNTPFSQIAINIPRQDPVISLLKRYIYLNFEFFKKADNFRYGNGKEIKLINLGPIDLFSNFKVTASSGKHSEDISLAHILSLMYKLITSSESNDDLSIGFHRDRGRTRDETRRVD